MRIGSLFSGIGAFELGLERAIPGAHTVWQVEQDPYARAVLAKHWPNARRYNDVREVGAHNLEPVDLICGGFPCQDISAAGKRAGITGSRSGLWSEYARIIRELRPRFVVVENVPALRFWGMGRVLGDLMATGGNYAIMDCIPAAAVGAPHRRDRIFLVAYTDGEPIRNKQSIRKKRQKSTKLGSNGEEKPLARFRPNEVSRITGWSSMSRVCRNHHGVSNRLDRMRCLGNAVVPQVAEVVGDVVLQIETRLRSMLDGGQH